jgi:hypothetical protein
VAYARLHQKLIRSYLIDALAGAAGKPTPAEAAREQAREFLSEAASCDEQRFPSIGQGEDLRYQKAGMTGSALVHDAHVIHTAFFRLDTSSGDGGMAGLRQRARWTTRS